YWCCSQGPGLFPGNFFPALTPWFWDIPGFGSTIRPLIGGRPRFSRGLHSVGPVASVAFLGYNIISTVGFSMDSQKVSAVLQWPRPSGLRSIQHFLGFANYYQKFIRNFSTLAK
ncbi:unnamed protein product, partial [Staurois parvus]